MITLKDIDSLYITPDKVVHALKGISLNIEKGEIFGIMGLKGSGKTTLIRCINLLERPTHGSVIFESCNLNTMSNTELKHARRKIGMIFQDVNLIASRTVFGNIALPLEFSKYSKAEMTTRINELLTLTHLTEYAHTYPEDLNLGLKHRVAIARALAQNPSVLLCDDFTADLDLKTTHFLLQLLYELNARLGLTLLFITHDLSLIKTFCHRVGILDQGTLSEQSTVVDFFTHPVSKRGKEFIKTATRLDMPMALRRRLRAQPTNNTHPVLRMVLKDSSSLQPIQNEIALETLLRLAAQNHQVSLNILQAYVETIQNENLKLMVIEIIGLSENVQNAIVFLKENHLHIEVLGHVLHAT